MRRECFFRLQRISGGSNETVLNELIVMPCELFSSSRQVITVTPVANDENPLRSSCEVNGVIGLAYLTSVCAEVVIVVPGIGIKISFSSALTHLKRYSLPALDKKLAPS